MPKFNVTVYYTRSCEKTFPVYARDGGEAEQKAEDIVRKWPGVLEIDATEAEEELSV